MWGVFGGSEIGAACFFFYYFVVFQGHQVEVQSNGGHVTGMGTIHGNVDISTKGDSVSRIMLLQLVGLILSGH